MTLRDITYLQEYNSESNDIVNDFLRPSLCVSKQYWRAVGYFSSSALELLGNPLGEFIKNDGCIKLVTSIELRENDVKAIENGLSKQGVCEKRLEEIIESEFTNGIGDGISRLTRLLEIERLEIRIAIPKNRHGIYHKKLGIFLDDTNYVTFSGSLNDGRSAYERNLENIDVFTSWRDINRANEKKEYFESLWNCIRPEVEIYEFPEALKKNLIKKVCESEKRKKETAENEKWKHQDEAVKLFLENKCGVLNMATGTGKTFTAIKIIQNLIENREIETIIVCTDGNDLLKQWYSELLKFQSKIEENFKIFKNFESHKESQNFLLNMENSILLVSRKPLANVLAQLDSDTANRTLLIHDEVHGLGSIGNRERLGNLSANIKYRLGLSATPERAYDDEGNEFINNHVGPTLFTFGLDEAIKRNILAPFQYFPLEFEPTSEDKEEVAKIHRAKAARAKSGSPMSEEEFRIKVAKVYKTSMAKIPIFKEFINEEKDLLKRCIIFSETMEFGQNVLEVVHLYRHDFHAYFSSAKVEVLKKFANEELECLITCHRLSEGIDIKSLNTVILFSSESSRLETIQRIGRCLRTNPKEPDKVANIVDFIRKESETDISRCNWLTELSKLRPNGEVK